MFYYSRVIALTFRTGSSGREEFTRPQWMKGFPYMFNRMYKNFLLQQSYYSFKQFL